MAVVDMRRTLLGVLSGAGECCYGGPQIAASSATASAAPPTIGAGRTSDVSQCAAVPHPQPWSTTSPTLHSVVTSVSVDGATVETYTTEFGIRSFGFDASTGFSLNGRRRAVPERIVPGLEDRGSLRRLPRVVGFICDRYPGGPGNVSGVHDTTSSLAGTTPIETPSLPLHMGLCGIGGGRIFAPLLTNVP